MINALHTSISELAQDRSLLEPDRLRQRIEVLDRLETCLSCGMPHDGDAEPASSTHLQGEIEALYARLETANNQCYQLIREEIQRGTGAAKLLAWAPVAGADEHADDQASSDSYDYLDALISGVLQMDEPDAGIADLAAEMVFYQPTPARHIFDLLNRTSLDEHDVLIDLGSGMGHVPLLAAMCTGARCIGIEWEAAYVDCARRCAHALGLNTATFVQQDARKADLSAGTVFYLYTPFTGTMLRDVLDMLMAEAAKRSIRICTLGPCTPTVAHERWLEAVGTHETHRPALFRSI